MSNPDSTHCDDNDSELTRDLQVILIQEHSRLFAVLTVTGYKVDDKYGGSEYNHEHF